MPKIRKIIWALDPFDRSLNVEEQTVPIVKALSSKLNPSIEPVYIMSDGMLGLSLPRAAFIKHYTPWATEALLGFLRRCKVKNVLAPKILVKVPSSRTSAAMALDTYARRGQASLILVNSHGHGGIKRALLGSFAETLALHSKTPVLISGPKTKGEVKLDHILFPTDLGKKSETAFRQVLELASQLGARITLFHSLALPIEPSAWVTPIGMAVIPPLNWNLMESQRDDAEKHLRAQAVTWASKAKKNGVNVDIHFDRTVLGVGQSIVHYATKKRIGLIALVSQSSAMATTLTGSIGRTVARSASCPVLILRK